MERTFITPEWEEIWCKALRSGDYEQGTGHLAGLGDENLPIEYCCLGVLQELVHPGCFVDNLEAAEMEWPQETVYDEVEIRPGVELGGESTGFFSRLADMNDKAVPFEVIATKIEQWNQGADIHA